MEKRRKKVVEISTLIKKILSQSEKEMELEEMRLFLKLFKAFTKRQKVSELFQTLEEYIKHAKIG